MLEIFLSNQFSQITPLLIKPLALVSRSETNTAIMVLTILYVVLGVLFVFYGKRLLPFLSDFLCCTYVLDIFNLLAFITNPLIKVFVEILLAFLCGVYCGRNEKRQSIILVYFFGMVISNLIWIYFFIWWCSLELAFLVKFVLEIVCIIGSVIYACREEKNFVITTTALIGGFNIIDGCMLNLYYENRLLIS